jgi:hypothetical protein
MSTPEIERLVDLLAKLPGLGPRLGTPGNPASDQAARPADAAAGGGHCGCRGGHPNLHELR